MRDYYRLRGGAIRLAPTIEGLVADGVLARVRLRESGDRRARRGRRRSSCCAAGPDAPTGAFLLSPFDNMLWDRVEADAAVRVRSPPRDLQAAARADLRLLRPAARRRAGDRRARRRQGRSGRRYPASARGALARPPAATGAARGARAPRLDARPGTDGDPLMEFETRAIHAGQEPDPLTGAVNVPIYQTSTYAQDGVGGDARRPRLRAHHQPDPDGARAVPRVARAGRARPRVRVGHVGDRRRARAGHAGPARDGGQRRVRRHLPAVLEGARPEGLPLHLRRSHDARSASRASRPSAPTWSGSRRRRTRS